MTEMKANNSPLIRVFENPPRTDYAALLARPVFNALSLEKGVRKILDKVKKSGDRAVRKLTVEFDGVKLKQLRVTEKEITQAANDIDPVLKEAITLAARNLRSYHSAQLNQEPAIDTMPGVRCWRKAVPIDRVGLYIPGGTAPLFSTVLMLGIPASLAGCAEVVLCSPPGKDGNIHPAILFAARESGIKKIFKIGGAQAIAAMAYGTESVPAIYKIFGPGNQYVNCAKQLIQLDGIAIDMPAGPSEVCVLADETADPVFVAADLLSQAEHGPDSQVVLVTTSSALVEKVQEEISQQLALLPRKAFAEKSLSHSKAILLNNMEECLYLVNEYAAEHLIIACSDADAIANKIRNAGSVFIGNYSPESVGDYASGTNHVLPTNAAARSYSGVSVDSFVKKISFQQLTSEGLNSLGPAVMQMAMAEGLDGHANAVSVRLKNK